MKQIRHSNFKKEMDTLWRNKYFNCTYFYFFKEQDEHSGIHFMTETDHGGEDLSLDSLPFLFPALIQLPGNSATFLGNLVHYTEQCLKMRTPFRGKLIFTEDAVQCCANLHEIWLPFINQDEYAPVHQCCLPSEFVVFSACWLEANCINHNNTWYGLPTPAAEALKRHQVFLRLWVWCIRTRDIINMW